MLKLGFDVYYDVFVKYYGLRSIRKLNIRNLINVFQTFNKRNILD
jgi:hypothetical protein